MITVKWIGGRSYTGPSLESIVTQMRESGWFSREDTDGLYMANVSGRAQRMGSYVRANSAENFIRDLETAGYVVVTEEAVQ